MSTFASTLARRICAALDQNCRNLDRRITRKLERARKLAVRRCRASAAADERTGSGGQEAGAKLTR